MSNWSPNGLQVTQQPILSPDQRAELARVQGMQVRTQAAQIAGMVLQHQKTSEARWAKFARVIEAYIRGELPADSPATPLRAGAETE